MHSIPCVKKVWHLTEAVEIDNARSMYQIKSNHSGDQIFNDGKLWHQNHPGVKYTPEGQYLIQYILHIVSIPLNFNF